MIYILIIVWAGFTTGTAGKTALAVEFNDLASCRAAAAEISKQKSPDVMVCAQKGKP